MKENDINYLQQIPTHCSRCHTSHFPMLNCPSTTSNPNIPCLECSKLVESFRNNNYKYCPHCGKQL